MDKELLLEHRDVNIYEDHASFFGRVFPTILHHPSFGGFRMKCGHRDSASQQRGRLAKLLPPNTWDPSTNSPMSTALFVSFCKITSELFLLIVTRFVVVA